MISSDPRLPVGRHPLAGGGMSLTIIASLLVLDYRVLFLHLAEEALYGVLHEAADCHRTYTARDRSNDRCLRLDCGIIHISAKLSCLRIAVYSYINDHRTL